MNSQPVIDPLAIAALDTERHVAAAGWDQPARLFALVRTADLLEREPQLREQMGPSDLAEGALTAIEQEGLPTTSSLETLLGRLAWPDEVDGCAFAIERMVVPPEAERELPARGEDAVDHLAAHPDRKDVRLVVAVLRDGASICLLRQRDHDSDDAVATGKDIAPGLVEALKATLRGLSLSASAAAARSAVWPWAIVLDGGAGLVEGADLEDVEPVGHVPDHLVAVVGRGEEVLRAVGAGAGELLPDAADRARPGPGRRWCRCRRSGGHRRAGRASACRRCRARTSAPRTAPRWLRRRW